MNLKNIFKFFYNSNGDNKDLKALWQKGNKLVEQGKIEEAEKLYLTISSEGTVIAKHYANLKLLELYDGNSNADEQKVKEVAKKDVELFPYFFEAWRINFPQVEAPYFPSFKILGEIYEKEENIEKAIETYKLATGYGVRDDYEERFCQKIERLKKKN